MSLCCASIPQLGLLLPSFILYSLPLSSGSSSSFMCLPPLLLKLVNAFGLMVTLTVLRPALCFAQRHQTDWNVAYLPSMLSKNFSSLRDYERFYAAHENSTELNQTLMLHDDNFIEHLCADTERRTAWIHFHSHDPLPNCAKYHVALVLGNVKFTDSTGSVMAVDTGSRHCSKEVVSMSTDGCETCLRRLFELDRQVKQEVLNFEELMNRYQCPPKSLGDRVHSLGDTGCLSCKTSYTAWLCSTKFHLFMSDISGGIPPCPSWCAEVERLCPFFTPLSDQDNSGEPVFLCSETHYHQTTRSNSLPPIASDLRLCEFLARQRTYPRCCYAHFHLEKPNSTLFSTTCSLPHLCAAESFPLSKQLDSSSVGLILNDTLTIVIGSSATNCTRWRCLTIIQLCIIWCWT